MAGWAQETTLDVEYAHAIAPGAKIVLAETPVAETEGTVGLRQMMNAEQSLINRGVGDVITQSFGATENTFPGFDGQHPQPAEPAVRVQGRAAAPRHGPRGSGRQRRDQRGGRRNHHVPARG